MSHYSQKFLLLQIKVEPEVLTEPHILYMLGSMISPTNRNPTMMSNEY